MMFIILKTRNYFFILWICLMCHVSFARQYVVILKERKSGLQIDGQVSVFSTR